MVMVFDNKRVVSLVGSSKLLKRKKLEKFSMFQWKRVLLFFMFFLCTIQRREIKIDSLMASPLVLNFGTILGWLPGRSLLVELPLRERIKRCQNLTAAAGNDPSPSPSHHIHTTHFTPAYTVHRYCSRWYNGLKRGDSNWADISDIMFRVLY